MLGVIIYDDTLATRAHLIQCRPLVCELLFFEDPDLCIFSGISITHIISKEGACPSDASRDDVSSSSLLLHLVAVSQGFYQGFKKIVGPFEG